MRTYLPVRSLLLSAQLLISLCAAGQSAPPNTPQAAEGKSLQMRPAAASGLPDAPSARKVVMIHSRPYLPPTQRQLFTAYLRDSYGLPALGQSTARSLYSEGRGTPIGWGTDAAGFGQRYGSNLAITAINGTVRYGMEEALHEDLRYIPCHGCNVKHKIENALLAEITARHHSDGQRFFTLTPTVSDFSGPIIAHSTWYPHSSDGPLAGVVSARTVFATRVGAHLFREFVLERRHKDTPEPR